MKQTPVEVNAPVALTRRRFLKTGSGVLMGTLMATGGTLAALAPSRTWALTMSALTDAEGDKLLKVTRAIFPHDTLDDAVMHWWSRTSMPQPPLASSASSYS